MIDAAQKILQDQSVLNAVAFGSAAIIGQVLHVIKKWAEGEEWVLVNAKRSIAAVIGNFASIAGFLSTPGALEGMNMGTILAFGVFMGIAMDSTINKGGRVAWTEAERNIRTG